MISQGATPKLEIDAKDMVHIILDPNDRRHPLYIRELNKILVAIDIDPIRENDPLGLLHFIEHTSETDFDIVTFTDKVRQGYISTLDTTKNQEKIAMIEEALRLLELGKLQSVIEQQKAIITAIVGNQRTNRVLCVGIGFAFATLLAAMGYIS